MNHLNVNRLFSLPARRPLLILVLLVLITGWLGNHALQLTLQPGFLNELPSKHPFAATYHEYNPQFGGGNVVVIALAELNGNIYSPTFMTALGDLTQAVLQINGVDPSTVSSLFTGNVTYREVTEYGYDGARVIPKAYDGSAAQIEQIRDNINRSREIGRLVALEQDGALIRFELAEIDRDGSALDYRQVGVALDNIRDSFESQGLEVRIIGFAPFVLAMIAAVEQVLLLMAVSLLVLVLVIGIKTGRVGAALAIAISPAFAVVGQLGLIAVTGGTVDPLSMLTPFLLYLFGVAVAWQLYGYWQADSGTAADGCANLLLKGAAPTLVVLLMLGGGLSLSLNSDLPLVVDFVSSTLLGLVPLAVALLVILPALMSFWVEPLPQLDETSPSDSTNSRSAFSTIVIVVLVVAVGLFARTQVRIGDDAGSGATQLSVDSRYNRDVDAILDDYLFGVDQLTLVAKSGRDGCLEFDVLHTVDRLIWELRNLPEVRSVYALPVYMKLSSIGHHEGFLRFYGYARQARGNTVNTWGTELRDKLYDPKCGVMPIRVFPVNHAESTLRKILDTAQQFADHNSTDAVSFEFALGNAAIRAAANDRVESVEFGLLIALALIGAAAVGLFSLNLLSVGPALLVFAAAASGIYPLLLLFDLGLNLTTLPAISIGLGWSLIVVAFASFARPGDVARIARVGGNAAIAVALALLPWLLAELRFQLTTGLLLTGFLLWIGLVGRFLLPRLWPQSELADRGF
ncbi:MAG: hypothetical protein JKY89_09430 [Immundisolibacteraceae bacterium]|nr:hypothetical protein [Immundisolibacteraceae bacterium]